MYRTALQSLLAKFRRHSSDRPAPKRRKPRRTRLAFESLEGRQMMDGLGLKFEFTFVGTVPPNIQAAAVEASKVWKAIFSDNVTVNLDIEWGSTGSLMETTFEHTDVPYADFRTSLATVPCTLDDVAAIASLPTAASFGIYINRTSENSSSAVPYLDNDGGSNNSTVWLTTANAKALGLIPARQSGVDATVVVDSSTTWDVTPGDGITANQFDLVGTFVHEFGHALGFVSGVDTLDAQPGFSDDSYPFVSPLDLFRVSTDSLASGALIDFTADNRTKFFSINRATNLANLATGVTYGDGDVAGHFREGTSLTMDPDVAAGELTIVQNTDVVALDVIGWHRHSTPWRNPTLRWDVNGDTVVTPMDVNNLITRINNNYPQQGSQGLPLPTPGTAPPMWVDVTGDNYMTPLDVLHVINKLNGQSGGEGEGSSAPVVNWGSLAFRQQNDVNISATDIWFQFTTTRTGTLSLEALFSHAAGNVDLELYAQGNLSSPLASSRTITNKERIDYPVSAGQAYYLRAVGSNGNVDFLAGNLVALSGSTVDVVGTTGNDTFTFQAGSAHNISVNGLAYSYSSASVNQVAFHGSSGADTATVTGSAASESASLSSTSFTFFGQGYTVTGDGVETKRAYSGGGNDYAYLYDTSGNDTYSTQVGYSYMSGGGYVSYAHNFYGVYGYASSGFDRSYFYDSAGNDTYYNTTTYSYMSGVGFYHYAGGFDDAYGYAIYGGYDRSYFYDSSSNDYFYGRSNYAYMSGGGVYKYGSGFDAVYAYGYNGGINTSDVQSVTYAFFRYGTWV